MARYYPAIVEQGPGGFCVFLPNLPSCTSAGPTLQEAAVSAEEALQAHVDLTAEQGEPIPAPSALDRIVADPDVIEAARILVRTEPPGQAVRVNITLPAELLAAVDRYATREGFTRSGLLAQVVRERVRREREAA